MRYSKEHKAEVRQHLLAKSGRYAKKNGFSAAGVDALAGAAGLTSGSLYKHFESKNTLFAALIEAEIDQTVSRFAKIERGDLEAVRKALASYLSVVHVRSPESGCPLPALTADVARAGDKVRAAFESGVQQFKNALTGITGSSDVAWTLIAQNVGAVMIARAMQDEVVSSEIIDAVRAAGEKLLVPGAK